MSAKERSSRTQSVREGAAKGKLASQASASALTSKRDADHVFRGENEILVDDIGHDLRKGLLLGHDKFVRNHMQGKVDANAKDEFGCYLLMAAAQGGVLSAVRDLLSRGARINAEDDHGNTALHLSVLFDHSDVAGLLLEQGADPEHRNLHGDRPGELIRERFYGMAFAAIKGGDLTTVQNLVGRDFIPTDIKEEACDLSHVRFVPRRFFQRCSKVGTLYYELEEETAEEYGKDREIYEDDFEDVVPSGAAQQAPKEATGPDEGTFNEEFASTPPDAGPQAFEDDAVAVKDKENQVTGRTLLMYGAQKGHLKFVKTLVRSHASILMTDSNGDTAISLAKNNKHFDVARYLNERLPTSQQTEIMTEETVELNELRKSFDKFCLLGSANLGASKGGRACTMDFMEFLKYLEAVGLAGPRKPCSKQMASDIFQWQMDVSTASGELEWPNFKQCLHRLAHQLHMTEIQGVRTEDLLDHTPLLDNRNEILKMPLTKVSRKNLQRELESMQRSLDLIGDQCRETTSCRYAAYGFGVTTGRHKLRNETFDVYRKLLRAPHIRMKMPKFTKDKEQVKKEMIAKQFFNLIDKDRSGSLTRYELQWALEDFGFTKEEQADVFLVVDADNSGTVTLPEFIAGLAEGNVSFAGRESKSHPKKTFLDIGMKISKIVNQKQQPAKILSISPGLFGMIFKTFCDFAMKERLYQSEAQSCLFSAPKTSALIPEKKIVKKQVIGINTRFSVCNPFDARVLANSIPVSLVEMTSFDSPCSKGSRTSSPLNLPSASISRGSSYDDVREIRPMTAAGYNQESSNELPLSKEDFDFETKESRNQRTQDERPHTSASSRDSKKHMREIKILEDDKSELRDGKSSKYSEYRLGTPVQTGSAHPVSAMEMCKLMTRRNVQSPQPQLTQSPDGSLLSEHTRVTLIPHRLTMTQSGQVLVGGVETTDTKTVTSIAALATKKHRITLSGIGILNRLVFNSISFGAGHCAAVTDTGLVYTWGQGRYGQLGHGDETDNIIPQPVRGIKGKVKSVSANFYHNVAVTVNGHLFTWGDGKDGKLGHNDNAGRLLPCLVSSFVDRGLHIISAQAGGSHSLALSSYNQIYSFGSGANGRLGHGNDNDQWSPTIVSALELQQIVSLAAGYAHSVALTDDGSIYTWGSGKLGRLGHCSDSDEVLPRKIALFSHSTVRPVSVAAGEAHTSILRTDGSMVTVGRVTHGRVAEGACAASMMEALHRGIQMHNTEDWHHFPA